MGLKHHGLLLLKHGHILHLVTVLELGGRDSTLHHVKFSAVHHLDHSHLRGKNHAAEIQLRLAADVADLFFCGIVVAHVIHRDTLIPEFSIGQVGNPDGIQLSRIGEQADSSRVSALECKPVLRIRRLLIALIDGQIDGLGIAEAVHEKHHVHLFRLLFLKYRLRTVIDHGSSGPCELLFDLVQLIYDDLGHGLPALQNILITIDIRKGLLMLFNQRLQLQTDELVQAHFQNGVGLVLRKGKLSRHQLRFFGLKADAVRFSFHQTGLRHGPVAGPSEDLDDEVDHIAGLDETFLNLPPASFLREQVLVFSGGHLIEKIHMGLQNRPKPQRLRPPVRDGQHIHAEGIFQTGLLIKHVDEVVHVRIPLQLDDDADALLGGLVGNVADVRSLFRFRQSRHIRQELADVRSDHGVGNFRDDHVGLSALSLFHLHLAADADLSGSRFIDGKQVVLVRDDTSRGKIRTV